MDSIDVRGLSCPEPVLRVRAAIGALGRGEQLEVLLETVTSRENILRAVHSLGCEVEIEARDADFRMVIRKP
jgi:TusA-related sulfurtransferase